MKKFWQYLLIFLVGAALIAGGGYYWHRHYVSSKAQQSTKVVKKQIHVVALGDSLTYGQGDDGEKGGYVGRIREKLANHYHTKVTADNFGVSGDRSDQILDRLNQQKQIRKSLKQADVIIMTVGGNDLMQSLQKDLLTGSSKSVEKDIDQAGQVYQTKLQTLFSAVRKQNPDAPIFVFSIYNPIYVYFPQVKVINDSIARWNSITQQTISSYSPAYFVDINHLMSYGQYRTQAERDQLVASSKSINSKEVSQKQLLQIMNQKGHNKNHYISTDDNFHPNKYGYQAMTRQLFDKMKQHDSFIYEQR